MMTLVAGGGEGLRDYAMYVDGDLVQGVDGRRIVTLNPTTGEPWATLSAASPEDVDRAVASAQAAFESSRWRDLSPTKRGRLLMRFGDLVAERADALAAIETREVGKLYRETVAQIEALCDWLYYYGGLADKLEGSVIPLDAHSALNYTVFEPVGVVGAIIPWNSPCMLTIEAIAPALAGGNTVVVKPSEVASASVLEMAALAEQAGLPPGVINVVTGDAAAGRALVSNPSVASVVFVGGTRTGTAVGEAVGARLKRSVLELGGKSANIVFADADLGAAQAGVLAGIFGAAGQSCLAGSMALIQAEVFDAFLAGLVERVRSIEVGDPMDATTEMGPLTTPEQLTRMASFVADARQHGAEVLVGGELALQEQSPNGYFFEPTVLGSTSGRARVEREEVFGPILTVLPFRAEADAIAAVNASRYGLAAGIWTQSIKRGHRVASQLQVGTVWVNMYRAVAFNSPAGGYKDSGVGRFNGIDAAREFLQTKSIWCELSDDVPDPFTLRV